MMQPVIELKRILKAECELYENIYSLEEEKSEAILEREGRLLESLSRDQELLIAQIDILEHEREVQIENYRKINNLDDLGRDISLKDIAYSMNEDSSQQLLQYGMDLKAILLKLQSKQATNKKLIDDNMEFFNLLMSGIRENSSEKAGYGSDGKEKSRVANPVMFNQTV
ncbi:MAG: flagellar protein FlgN [bacterium]|nr:flagellar protein FlgN [bacterium]